MCHKSRRQQAPSKDVLEHVKGRFDGGAKPSSQGGSMLLISLFVIIVMALLGLTLNRLLSASTSSIIYEVYGLRALNAARAGMDAKLALAFPISGAASCSATGGPTDFTSIPGLEGCQASAQCRQLNVIDGSISRTLYKFSSTGICMGGDIVASRTVQVDGL